MPDTECQLVQGDSRHQIYATFCVATACSSTERDNKNAFYFR